jgi:ADP-ribose pyrophosphatase YjhB (NUDIX family)
LVANPFGQAHGYFHHADHNHDLSCVHCLRCGAIMGERLLPDDDRPRLVCGACGFVFYQNPKIVVATIPEWDDKVVLVKRAIEPRKGTWSYPGGFLELGESVEEGALRETKEETNLDIRITVLLNVYSRPVAGVVVIVFGAEVIGGNPVASAEIAEICRFAPAEIPWPELSFPTTEWALRDWLARHPAGIPQLPKP